MLHDWLDYAGRYLEARYRKGNPLRLSEIWTKHNRTSTLANIAELQKKSPTPGKRQAKARVLPANPPTNLSYQPTNQPKPAEVMERWNVFAKEVGLSPVLRLNDKRTRGVKKRLADPMFDLEKIFTLIRESDHLCGRIRRPEGDPHVGWKVHFDFVFCTDKYIEILEGKYSSKRGAPQGSKRVDAMEYLKGRKR